MSPTRNVRVVLAAALVSSALFLFAPAAQQPNDWENPAVFERNQVPTHVPLVPYDNLSAALQDDWETSPHLKLLNGYWKFNWVPVPEQSPEGFYRETFDVEAWPEIWVPGNWQMQGYGHPLFRNVSHTFVSDPPRVPRDYNPVGSYRRSFSLPQSWINRQVFLHFDGVKSASYVWINGRMVGYNQGGMEPAEYDVTAYVRPGSNSLSVQVLRYSDGTYLEDQDMWRLSGIFRDVYLFSSPRVHVRDFYVWTDLDDRYENATLHAKVEIENYTENTAKAYQLRLHLFDAEGMAVLDESPLQSGIEVQPGRVENRHLSCTVKAPRKWSAESPYLYRLVLELIDSSGGSVEFLAGRVGFREVEVRDQAILINGVAVKFNGVNRHEHDPDAGRTMTTRLMRKDLELMKQFNINLVRTSHYPPDPEFLDLADEYGIYVVDEVGDEAHANRHLSADPAWLPAYLERMQRMVRRDRNHPSIIFWSAGNESGIGQNLAQLIQQGKELDPSRPAWMYGATSVVPDQPFEEIIGPRYPHPSALELIAQVPGEKDPRPSFMDEYDAATGNSLGHFQEYWDLIYRYRRLTGGAIWDWVSPGLRQKLRVTPDSSEFRNDGFLMGGARLVAGRFGQAVSLSGRDEWVELYRSPSLDVTGKELTLATWIYPRGWNGTGTFITKGDRQYGLLQSGENTLEFFIFDARKVSVQTSVPPDWNHRWHHLAGVYDGATLRLYVDGELRESKEHSGSIDHTPYPLNIGRDARLHGQNHTGPLCNAIFDEVRLYSRALAQDELRRVLEAPDEVPRAGAVLWLKFDRVEERGEFFSLGIGARAYGLVWPDRRIQPELWQVKKSPQPVLVEPVDSLKGKVKITNRYHFTNLNRLDAVWELTADAKVVQRGALRLDLPAGESRVVTIPFREPEIAPGVEYRLLLSFRLREDTVWARKGHELAWEQLHIPFQTASPPVVPVEDLGLIHLRQQEGLATLTGQDFKLIFDKHAGTIRSLQYQGRELIQEGPTLSLWRAPTSNETDEWRNPPIVNQWYEVGLNRLETEVREVKVERLAPQAVRISVETFASAPGTSVGFQSDYRYQVLGTGDVILHHKVTAQGQFPDWQPGIMMWLPRIGLQMKVPVRLSNISWYGRGPFETYPDRKSGAKIGVYSGTIAEQFVPYLVPQDYGNKTEVRWALLADEQGIGLLVRGFPAINLSAHHYSTDNLTRAQYPFQLKPDGAVTLNIDHRVTGVGGTPVPTLESYRVLPSSYEYTIVLRPLSTAESPPMDMSRQRLPYMEADFE